MTNLAILIPVALLLGAAGLAAFLWALRSGQYEDLDGAAERVLYDDETRPLPPADDEPAHPHRD
ncbi:cbb3-type cytochrome oxidase assembly protein CcoS [Aquibium sp. A9E412]|uniref:cbb3-type cytochrome oxidase assembly protein CcoS n=1 Tax=Aquibium sp. A9E412 TaxID=2976767 RepID=UPI0025AFDF88|nr:cbb3-type cytochrome oxidase assembly protein CcoS [Aquibium sp. A9E412]MDN2567585.1 cbb3-type cytochrome oxidase assembly protein CcoS [Aquibium sp. A9E412]